MDAGNSQCNIQISRIGSFFSGGRITTLQNQPEHCIQVANNAPERVVDLNGDYVTGQCYVQYIHLTDPVFEAPIMFWHGGAMTGATWESTPDGRPGWQQFFLNLGYDTYVCDAMERGRAGWSPYPEIYESAPIFRTLDDAWELFRFGEAEGYHTRKSARKPYEGLQFPMDQFDNFGAQFVPRWTQHSQQTLDAYYSALKRVGPVWLIAHSQGGHLALEAAANHPEYFKGLVIVEPASAPVSTGNAHKVPHLFIWGDYIEKSETWKTYRKYADTYADDLQRQGGQVHIWDLPASGISGNSHLPMMDRNSDDIARRVAHWFREPRSV